MTACVSRDSDATSGSDVAGSTGGGKLLFRKEYDSISELPEAWKSLQKGSIENT